MAATFHERDNCGGVYLSGLYKRVCPPRVQVVFARFVRSYIMRGFQVIEGVPPKAEDPNPEAGSKN